MSTDSNAPNPPATFEPRPKWWLAVWALLGAAILGAGYLAWVSISQGSVAGCGPGSDCNKVLQSRWAYWLTLPVSVPALLVYLGLLASSILARKRLSPDEERGTWTAIITLAVMVAGAALWFVGLQVFVLRAFCKFCMAAHACGFTAALLCLKNIPLAGDPTTPMWSSGSQKRGIPRSAVLSLVVAGLAGVTLLVGGQLLVQKERNVVVVPRSGEARGAGGSALPAAAGVTNSPASSLATNQPPSPDAHLIAPRILSLYNNQFLVKLDDVPLMGSPDAPNVIVYLFDYTCVHCRALHAIVATGQRQFSNQLAVVLLPMPISTNCNPLIPGDFASNSNACEYARLGLAIWRAKPEAFRQFDDWFFAPEKPVSLEQAQAYAAELVGADRLQWGSAHPGVQQQILADCQIHFANWQATGRPAMPQLILGPAVSIGPLNSVEHLLVLLNRYLGMDVGLNRRMAPSANPPQTR